MLFRPSHVFHDEACNAVSGENFIPHCISLKSTHNSNAASERTNRLT